MATRRENMPSSPTKPMSVSFSKPRKDGFIGKPVSQLQKQMVSGPINLGNPVRNLKTK